MPTFIYQSDIPASAADVFAWHEQPDAIHKLIPPEQKVEVVKPPSSLEPGTEVHLKMYLGPFSVDWFAKHTDYEKGHFFTDIQEKGPLESGYILTEWSKVLSPGRVSSQMKWNGSFLEGNGLVRS